MSEPKCVTHHTGCECWEARWRDRLAFAKRALEQCGAAAGHPDAAEGCRIVCKTVKDALKALHGGCPE